MGPSCLERSNVYVHLFLQCLSFFKQTSSSQLPGSFLHRWPLSVQSSHAWFWEGSLTPLPDKINTLKKENTLNAKESYSESFWLTSGRYWSLNDTLLQRLPAQRKKEKEILFFTVRKRLFKVFTVTLILVNSSSTLPETICKAENHVKTPYNWEVHLSSKAVFIVFLQSPVFLSCVCCILFSLTVVLS